MKPAIERKPAHALRPSTDNRRNRRKHAPVEETRADLTRPEGWYMQPVNRASAQNPIGWPPRFTPTINTEVQSGGLTPSEKATAAIERGRAEGKWHASGTVPMQHSPKFNKMPGPLNVTR